MNALLTVIGQLKVLNSEIIDIILRNGLLIRLLTSFFPRLPIGQLNKP